MRVNSFIPVERAEVSPYSACPEGNVYPHIDRVLRNYVLAFCVHAHFPFQVYTHTLSLFLSLSLSYTHTHTLCRDRHKVPDRVRAQARWWCPGNTFFCAFVPRSTGSCRGNLDAGVALASGSRSRSARANVGRGEGEIWPGRPQAGLFAAVNRILPRAFSSSFVNRIIATTTTACVSVSPSCSASPFKSSTSLSTLPAASDCFPASQPAHPQI